MKILKKATMPNGTEIQLEDWSDTNTAECPDLYGLTIGAYPTAKNSSKYKWIEAGNKFRVGISANKYSDYSNDDVKSDFEALKSEEKTLEDLAPHFWNGEKDMYLLGMIDSYEEVN
jgi:hypothetical protein